MYARNCRVFKRKLIEAVYILLCVGEFGPIQIHMNNEMVVSLTTDNLHVLVDIVDPKRGSELWSRCLNRVANGKSFSKVLQPCLLHAPHRVS